MSAQYSSDYIAAFFSASTLFSSCPHPLLFPAPFFFFNISMALDQDTYFQASFSLMVLYFTQARSPWPGRPPLRTPSVLFTLQGKGHVSAAAASLHSHRSHFFPLTRLLPQSSTGRVLLRNSLFQGLGKC